MVTLLLSVFTLIIAPAGLSAYALNSTSTTVTPNPSMVNLGKTVTFKAKVVDTNVGAKTSPTGMVSWSDGGKGGHFATATCTLVAATTSVSACTIVYTPPTTPGSVTITGTYLGDTTHAGSFGSSALTVNHSMTSTTVTPNPSSVNLGKTVTFKAKVADVNVGSKTAPTGMVTWSDGGKGGHFATATCTLVAATTSVSACTIVYTPSSTPGPVTITGTYLADSIHIASLGTSALTVNHSMTTTTVTPNPSAAMIGKTITFKARVADVNVGAKSAPTGMVSWDDGGKGGVFSSATCTLVSATTSVSSCTIKYAPPLVPGSITITGTYHGDSIHAGSAGTSSLTVS